MPGFGGRKEISNFSGLLLTYQGRVERSEYKVLPKVKGGAFSRYDRRFP